MFTNEYEFDHTKITVIDDDDEYEDIQIVIEEDLVLIKQYSEDSTNLDLIAMSPKMLAEIVSAYHLPEGAYTSK